MIPCRSESMEFRLVTRSRAQRIFGLLFGKAPRDSNVTQYSAIAFDAGQHSRTEKLYHKINRCNVGKYEECVSSARENHTNSMRYVIGRNIENLNLFEELDYTKKEELCFGCKYLKSEDCTQSVPL